MPPKELLHLYNFIVVDSAAVLADVHAHGIYGALVGGEAHGVVLDDDLVGGFFGRLAVFQFQYVDGVGHFQGDVHAPVARLVLGLYVGFHGKQRSVSTSNDLPKHRGRLRKKFMAFVVTILYTSAVLSTYTAPLSRILSNSCTPTA